MQAKLKQTHLQIYNTKQSKMKEKNIVNRNLPREKHQIIDENPLQ